MSCFFFYSEERPACHSLNNSDITLSFFIQGNPKHAIIGTEKRPEKAEDGPLPGPGAHDPRTGAVKGHVPSAVISKDQTRHGYINKDSARNPGPGAYSD